MTSSSEPTTAYERVECDGRQPPWHRPVPHPHTTPKTNLVVHNSLTGKKEPFTPAHGNLVKWYTCGPTVYDVCHMGHARAYLTMDIIRRLLEDYFNYDVFLQVNVTDIDDKIIKRARHHKLVADFVATPRSAAEAIAHVERAMAAAQHALDAKLAKLEMPLPRGREEDERAELLKQHRAKMEAFVETRAAVAAAASLCGVHT